MEEKYEEGGGGEEILREKFYCKKQAKTGENAWHTCRTSCGCPLRACTHIHTYECVGAHCVFYAHL